MRRVLMLLAAGLSVLALSTAANAAIQTAPFQANLDAVAQTAPVTQALPATDYLAGHACYSNRGYYRPSYGVSYGYRPSYGYGYGGYGGGYRGYGGGYYGGYPRGYGGYGGYGGYSNHYRGGSGFGLYIGF